MTLRHLKIFVSVCKHLSMTKAANELYMTQPSISQAIGELETEYGVVLFHRMNRKLYLTKAGETLLHYARRMLALEGTVYRSMSQYHHLFSLRIGATLTIGETMFVPFLEKLTKAYPKGKITSIIVNTEKIEHLLLEDKLDVAFVEGRLHSPYIKTRPFYSDEIVLVASPMHEAAKRILGKQELSQYGFLLRESGSGTRVIFEEGMKEAEMTYHIQGIYNGAEVLKQAAKANLGIAVLSKLSVEKELQEGILEEIKIKGKTFQRQFVVAYHKDKEHVEEINVVCDWSTKEGIFR